VASSSTSQRPDAPAVLLCRVRDRLCAIPVGEVDETMRPQPVSPLPHAQHFVAGVARIRGAPIPVIDAGLLLGGDADGPAGRFVLLRIGDRRVALAVESVVGVRRMPADPLQPLPPLLSEASRDAVAAIAALDGELLLVLEGVGLLPADSQPLEVGA
jgi:purine-binding chemotaxis protein CheW